MKPDPRGSVKCVVWDLDDTLWHGILSEGGGDRLRPGVARTLAGLNERGVLHSIASRNEPDHALSRLADLGVADYFLCPQISWQPKSESVGAIASTLNIGLDTVLFVDDLPFERAEVAHAHPQVRCVDAVRVPELLERPEFDLPVTPESRLRRTYYRQAEVRQAYEVSFPGPRTDFLASLGMKLTIAPAAPADLARAAELTRRTHQLNTTGLVFGAGELEELMRREDHWLLTVALQDCFGSYGTIGLVLLKRQSGEWRIRLLLMSCRVMGRNVGGAVIAYLARQARMRGVALTADFLPNAVNRQMYIVYRLAGFVETARDGEVCRLQLKAQACPTSPGYVDLQAADLPGL